MQPRIWEDANFPLSHARESGLYKKVILRIIPFIFICYVLNYIDTHKP